jgi:predicted peroxiredoxin
MKKKFMVMINHSTDDHDRANLALGFVAGMLIEEIDVVITLMFEGALLGKKGVAETLVGRNMTPGKEIIPLILEAKVPINVCAPCAKTMGVGEADLVPGAKIVTAPTVIALMHDRQVVTF